jgi:hypothetical protein
LLRSLRDARAQQSFHWDFVGCMLDATLGPNDNKLQAQEEM